MLLCELRRKHPRWRPVRLVHELGRLGVDPVPSRMSVYRALVRHGLIEPKQRRGDRRQFRRWERDEPMALWQMDIVGGLFLVDGSECKVVTGVDDHSRFCVIASVVKRATGRAVCLAFANALRTYGVPEEVLTDNGKQFTDRFGHGASTSYGPSSENDAATNTHPQHSKPHNPHHLDNPIENRPTRQGSRPGPRGEDGAPCRTNDLHPWALACLASPFRPRLGVADRPRPRATDRAGRRNDDAGSAQVSRG